MGLLVSGAPLQFALSQVCKLRSFCVSRGKICVCQQETTLLVLLLLSTRGNNKANRQHKPVWMFTYRSGRRTAGTKKRTFLRRRRSEEDEKNRKRQLDHHDGWRKRKGIQRRNQTRLLRMQESNPNTTKERNQKGYRTRTAKARL